MPLNILGFLQKGFDNKISILGFALHFKTRTFLKWLATGTIINFFENNIFKHFKTKAQQTNLWHMALASQSQNCY